MNLSMTFQMNHFRENCHIDMASRQYALFETSIVYPHHHYLYHGGKGCMSNDVDAATYIYPDASGMVEENT